MNTKVAVLSMVAFLMLGSSLALADSNPNSDDVAADRARYQGLLREIRSVDAEYAGVLQQAVRETEKDGAASLETKSRLLALSDKRDRIMNRLTLLSIRHGWEFPDGDSPNTNISKVPEERERVFQRADQMIRQKFAQDARRIAGMVTLPVVSIDSVRQTEQAKEGKAK